MRIHELTATFGGLNGATLAPGEGLTVIYAPNEGGKTTWSAFLRAMLYGIDTRERDKAGFLAEKNRWLPWSGAAMSGEMDLSWKQRNITVRRFPSKTNPFGGFQAVYADTGDPVPGLTGKNLGEKLIGAGREVYTRSAFVGQGGSAVGQNNELEAKVSSLATTGQEDVSWSATEHTLKEWRNRRKANSVKGLIPDAERELSRAERALREMSDIREQQGEAKEQLSRLERERDRLQETLDAWERADRHVLHQRYEGIRKSLEAARQSLEDLDPPEPEMADWTAEQAASWAEGQERACAQAAARRESALQKRIEMEHRSKTPGSVLLALALLFSAGGILLAVLDAMRLIAALNPAWFGLLVLGTCVCLLLREVLRKRAAKQAASLEVPPEPERVAWRERAARHAAYLEEKARLEGEARHGEERLADLRERGAEADVSAPADVLPDMPQEDAAARLQVVEQAIHRWHEELARANGALHQMGDPEELESRRDFLQGELARRGAEYQALTTALDVLSEANEALRRRFSPALSEKAGEIFSELTGGRWRGLTLARDFSAGALSGDGQLPRAAPALSTGTAEQLYLAVRLAICELTLPDAPLVLDDALCVFDDNRMTLALSYLKKLGESRQILFFSCQTREAAWARANGVPVLEL